jgi:tagatose-6-phosphate ketose/aldose isomerase
MPAESNDQSFAMTSSFTGMMVAAWLVLDLPNLKTNGTQLQKTIKNVSKNMVENYELLAKIAQLDHQRIVFLGSGVLKGISQEAHLKVLELSAGQITSFFNTPVGFRHGPKSILNHQSIAFILMNQDSYAREYDEDLLHELAQQHQLDKIVVLDYALNPATKKVADYYLVQELTAENDFLLGLNYIVACQIYAFYKSLFLGKTPDNP